MNKKKEKKKQKNKNKTAELQERMENASVTAADENQQTETDSKPDAPDEPETSVQTAAAAETKETTENEEKEKQLAGRTRKEVAYDLYCAGKTFEEIAEEMGVTTKTVKQYVGSFSNRHYKLAVYIKNQSIRFRVTDSELAVIREKAYLSGLSVSEYVLKCALERRVPGFSEAKRR